MPRTIPSVAPAQAGAEHAPGTRLRPLRPQRPPGASLRRGSDTVARCVPYAAPCSAPSPRPHCPWDYILV